MNAGQTVDYLRIFDENDEIEIEVRFSETGESHVSTFDVSAGPHEGSEAGRIPVISAGIGFGAMPDADLDLPTDCIKGIDERLGYYRDGA